MMSVLADAMRDLAIFTFFISTKGVNNGLTHTIEWMSGSDRKWGSETRRLKQSFSSG